MAKSLPSPLPPNSVIYRAVADALDALIESRTIEYKRSDTFESLQTHIIKTAMGLSNLREGGVIVVGVERTINGLKRAGISANDLATYDSDDVLAAINKYAAPAVDAVVATVDHKGVNYLVIAVQEFTNTPTLCAKDSSWGSAGTMYVRPRGFIETRLPKTAAELDEVLELAAEKKAIRMMQQREVLNAATGGIGGEDKSEERYDDEVSGLGSL